MTSTSSAPGCFELLIGMHVADEVGYQRYRDAMTPILESMGGTFRYDLRVSEMLRGEADDPFNRVFILSFPDAATRDRFFADETYAAVKAEHFEDAVASWRTIAEYVVG